MTNSKTPDRMLGAILMRKGSLTRKQLDEALRTKEKLPALKLGEIIVNLGYCPLSEVAEALELQGESLRLGELLLMNGQLSQYELELALEEQFQSGQRLGDVLTQMGLVSAQTIEGALRNQKRQAPLRPTSGRSSRFRRDR